MEAARRHITYQLDRIVMLRRIRLYQEKFKGMAEDGFHAGQFPALDYIIRHDGCSQKELAEQFHVTPASVALMTKQMQKSGLIVKNSDNRCLRKNCLSATKKGVDTAAICREAFAEFDSRVYAGLTSAEMATLGELLQKLLNNLTAYENDADTIMCGAGKPAEWKGEVI